MKENIAPTTVASGRFAMANPANQTGASLLIGLIILLVLTLLGLSSSNVSMMQERMAGNFSQYGTAFQNAEDTLRQVESRLQGLSGGTGGLGVIDSWTSYAINHSVALEINDCSLERAHGGSWDQAPWQDFSGLRGEYLLIDLLDQPACRPMEEDTGTPQGAYFLIVARADDGIADGSRRAEAIVQSLFFWP